MTTHSRRLLAFTCAAQVLLLSLASVSPGLHDLLFHSGFGFAQDDCGSGETGCAGGSDDGGPTAGGGAHDDAHCPVTLFAEGAVGGERSPELKRIGDQVVSRVSYPVDRRSAIGSPRRYLARAPPAA